MKYGLDQNVIDAILDCLASNPKIEEAVLYGSRAKGNYKNGSDIDICLKGSALQLDDVFALENQLDDLSLPYKFDISTFNHVKNADLMAHIQRVGITLYKKQRPY